MPGGGLWLSPTRQGVGQIRDRLLNNILPGCFAPAVHTFEEFAQAVLACTDQQLRFLGRLLKRQLIEQIISDAISAGTLQYFAPIAKTTGLIDLVGGFISDLKRQEIWPEEFTKRIESIGATAKDRELAAIYSEYQRR